MPQAHERRRQSAARRQVVRSSVIGTDSNGRSLCALTNADAAARQRKGKRLVSQYLQPRGLWLQRWYE
jgi:hypothetical protein